VQAADSAGAILGPLLAWMLLRQAHWSVRAVFLAAAIPGLLCVVSILGIVREPRHEFKAKNDVEAGNSNLPRSFWIVLVIVAIFSLGASSDMFLVLRAKEVGIAVAFAPLLGLVFNTVYTVAAWPAGALSDRMPRHVVASMGYLVYGLVYAAFAFAPLKLASGEAKLTIWLAMAFYGLFYALTEPVLKALVVSGVPKTSRGRAVGIYSFVVSICVLTSSAATGLLWKQFGGALPLGISAALAIAAAVLLLLVPTTSKAAASEKESSVLSAV